MMVECPNQARRFAVLQRAYGSGNAGNDVG